MLGAEEVRAHEWERRAVGWRFLLAPSAALRRMLLVGVGVAAAQQIVGIDGIQYFMLYLLEQIRSRRLLPFDFDFVAVHLDQEQPGHDPSSLQAWVEGLGVPFHLVKEDTYCREIKDGKPHGLGVKSWPDGEKYSGDWFEGERSGHGVWTGPTGDDYKGDYKRDKRNGVGVYMFASGASGATYEGDFKDGKPHGTGVYTFRSGKKTLDTYKNGEEVSSQAYNAGIGDALISKAKGAADIALAGATKADKVLQRCQQRAKSIRQ